jgi:pimeloyl-ACP methyl ester carboxylesterase
MPAASTLELKGDRKTMSPLRSVLGWLVLAGGLIGCAGGGPSRSERSTDRAWTSAGVSAGSYLLTPDVVTDEEGRTVSVERGLVFVPENRRAPDSRLIAVHFVRFPSAQRQEPARAPVFLLPGGPGWDFDFSDPLVFDEIERLRQTREVISVSQRGYSGAPGLVPELRVRYGASAPDTLTSARQRAERDRESLAAALEHWRKLGVDVTGYDILNITDDVNDLRKALGYERIVLRGCSFGSQWSLAYMKRWPETVDRAFLSGVEPLDFGYDSPRWLWASLARVAKAAEADPDLAPHVPEGGLMQALKTVIERLEAQPVKVTIRGPSKGADIVVPVSADDLRGLLTNLSLNQRRALQNLAQWPRFILELYRGDYRFLAVRVLKSRAGERSESLIIALINHSLGISPARAARLMAEPEASWLGDINLKEHVTRGAAPTPQVDDLFRADWRIDIPTLLVAGDYDWSTPVENAEHLSSFLNTGHLVTVRGGRHCSETNHGELASQLPKETKQLYGFVDAASPRDFFKTLPAVLSLAPIDFAPLTGRSLYEEWLAGRD